MASRLAQAFATVVASERARRLRAGVHDAAAVVLRRAPPITFFHRVGDAWSWLLAQGLRELAGRYDLDIDLRLVSALPVDCVPDPERLDRYAAYDADRLARAWSFDFATGAGPPAPRLTRLAERVILARPRLQTALTATAAAWRGDDERLARMAKELGAVSEHEAALALTRNFAALKRGGHYLGGTCKYRGEWFWGLDRLDVLEARLREYHDDEGAALAERFDPLPRAQAGSPGQFTLEFYFSFRSPYSYLAAREVFGLADRLGLDLQLRPLVPMVARGVPAPRRKLLYILTDAARLARRRGLAFGPFRDPLGAGVERCLAVLHEATAHGTGREFVLAAMRAIWTRAADLSRDAPLQAVAAEAGLTADVVAQAVATGGWRAQLEANAAALAVLGLWGVPSMCLRGPDGQPATVAWGQDRVWAVERAALGIDMASTVPGLVQ